jgi:hypothetical protein
MLIVFAAPTGIHISARPGRGSAPGRRSEAHAGRTAGITVSAGIASSAEGVTACVVGVAAQWVYSFRPAAMRRQVSALAAGSTVSLCSHVLDQEP